jgi:nuclear pore complex protein Nup155
LGIPPLITLQLFNKYADSAGYYDVCLLIYEVADHRDTSQVKATWQQLLQNVHDETVEQDEAEPYEAVADKVRSLGSRLRLSESTFPIPILLPMLEKYGFEHQRNVAPEHWVIDLFLDLQVPYESLFDTLEAIFYTNDVPFLGINRKVIANDLIELVGRWLNDTMRGGGIILDSEQGALRVDHMMQALIQEGSRAGMDDRMMHMSRLIRERIAQLLH